MQQLIILTGMSGAGKTVVLRTLEDLEYYAVDNLPVGMLMDFVQHICANRQFYPKVAIGIDIRNSEQALDAFPSLIERIRSADLRVKMIYLNASDEVLFNRFSETRRRHPLSTAKQKYSLTEAIKKERGLMQSLLDSSDLLIDTDNTSVHQLRQNIWKLLSQKSDRVSIILRSFAFKRGIPFDSDFVFDARCLPNPYWDRNLRSLTGRDEAVVAFLDKEPLANEFYRDLCTFGKTWLPRFEANDRSYIAISIGCTGGQHRSVYVVEKLAGFLKRNGIQCLISHRELD